MTGVRHMKDKDVRPPPSALSPLAAHSLMTARAPKTWFDEQLRERLMPDVDLTPHLDYALREVETARQQHDTGPTTQSALILARELKRLSNAFLLDGRHEAAVAASGEAKAIFEAHGKASAGLMTRLTLERARAELGVMDREAWASMLEACEGAHTMRNYAPFIHRAMARAHIVAGSRGEARAALEAAVAHWKAQGAARMIDQLEGALEALGLT